MHREPAWGSFSLVATEVDLFRLARTYYTQASYFYLVPGDAVPVKPPACFVDPFAHVPFRGLPHSSMLGLEDKKPRSYPVPGTRSGVRMIWQGSQWKMLTRDDVGLLASRFDEKKQRKESSAYDRDPNASAVNIPDEWVVHSVLGRCDVERFQRKGAWDVFICDWLPQKTRVRCHGKVWPVQRARRFRGTSRHCRGADLLLQSREDPAVFVCRAFPAGYPFSPDPWVSTGH